MFGHPPPRLLDVVDGDVLEEARDGVQAQASAAIHVRQANLSSRGERSALAGRCKSGVKHEAASLLARAARDKQSSRRSV